MTALRASIRRSLRATLAALLVLFAVILPQTSWAQAAASAYTSGVRYDLMRRVVGTIKPDPDGTSALKYAAVRNTYSPEGWLVKVESGELAAWQAEAIAPSAWTGFTILMVTDSSFDASGRKIKDVMSNAGVVYGVTQYSYDAIDRPVCTAVRMNPATFASPPSDACALGVADTYGNDRITKNFYDADQRLSRVQKAVGTSLQQNYVTYTYTLNGQQATVTDANGTMAQFAYDALDRKTRWSFSSKTTAGLASTADYEDYGYDADGNRTSMRKRDGRVFTFTYDALNRVTSKIVPDACVVGFACTNVPATATRDVFYAYDLRGLQLSARFDSGAGEGITNIYDGAGRLTSSANSMGGVTRTLSYLWDKDSQRTRVTHPDGNYFAYGYDGLDRPTTIRENAATTNLATHSYDTRQRLSSRPRYNGTTTSVAMTTFAYETGTVYATATPRPRQIVDDLLLTAGDLTTSLTWNPSGQIVTRARSNDGYVYGGDVTLTRQYTVNGLNQYVTGGPASYGYDANGNLTSDGSLTLSYDAENRLVSASGAKTASLVYDPLGRLFETSGGAAGVTRFLYDGDELVAEYTGTGTLLRRYVHGNGADDPLIWYEGAALATRRHLFGDHQGSITAVADATGTLSGINSYDDWGVPGATNSASRFAYTGQAYIPELGMYHYKARI